MGNPEGKRPFGTLDVGEKMILKCNLKTWDGWTWTGLMWLGTGTIGELLLVW
jgi:hypothetical protein